MILPTPRQLHLDLPLNLKVQHQILDHRKQIENILLRKDKRTALIIGPCSIHNFESAKEYAFLLKELSKKIAHSFFVVMRAYIEKPRSSTGWKGFLYDPFLNDSCDISSGLFLSRKLLKELAEIGIPLAAEFLDPIAHHYYNDLISWGFIGARTCTSSIHRQIASSLDMPIGFKNTTEGNIDEAINGIISARSNHPIISINDNGLASAEKSLGNNKTHLVLRGASNFTNYDSLSVQDAIDKLKKAEIYQGIITDCSHGNSGKRYEKQKEVFLDVIGQIKSGNKWIAGLMVESFLKAGNQQLHKDPSQLCPQISVTDPCIDWESTKELLLEGSKILSSSSRLELISSLK